MTLLDKANRLPPFVCRLLARKAHGRRSLSTREIAKAAGLSKSTVANLALKWDWTGVPLDAAVRYALACGVNHLNAKRQVDYLCRRAMSYASTGGPAERKLYGKLFRMLEQWSSQRR